MINRAIEKAIAAKSKTGKAIVIIGPRQSGKTTLIKKIFGDQHALWWSGDEPDVRAMLSNVSSSELKLMIGKHQIVVIDEAQRINEVGLLIKLIIDYIPGITVVASGSSAFELSNKTQEPLTGRKWEFQLLPMSFAELSNHFGLLGEKRLLNHRLVFGSYPEVINHPGDEKSVLKELSNSYLYKDLLMLEGINKPEKLNVLLQAIAFQLGSEVSYNELSRLTGLDNQTVERYVTLLEKSFVIFRLQALSRNLRNEIRKSRKIYFYDNGIRNAIIGQFGDIQFRQDRGALWENYLISERMKMNLYEGKWVNSYFWRTHDQQEIDYVEEEDGKMSAFEFKWSSHKSKKIPASFQKSYDLIKSGIVDRDNYSGFLHPELTNQFLSSNKH